MGLHLRGRGLQPGADGESAGQPDWRCGEVAAITLAPVTAEAIDHATREPPRDTRAAARRQPARGNQTRRLGITLLAIVFVVIPLSASEYLFRAILIPFLILALAAIGLVYHFPAAHFALGVALVVAALSAALGYAILWVVLEAGKVPGRRRAGRAPPRPRPRPRQAACRRR